MEAFTQEEEEGKDCEERCRDGCAEGGKAPTEGEIPVLLMKERDNLSYHAVSRVILCSVIFC
jgi:hypothetical protein